MAKTCSPSKIFEVMRGNSGIPEGNQTSYGWEITFTGAFKTPLLRKRRFQIWSLLVKDRERDKIPDHVILLSKVLRACRRQEFVA